MLRVDQLLTTLGKQPNSLSGALPAGQIAVVLGRNGAGKSWLIRTLAGLNPVASGTAHYADQPLDQTVSAARQRGYLAQEETRLYPSTVLQHALSARSPWLEWHQSPARHDEEIALAAIDRLGISDHLNHSIQSLSGGEWQRVRLATLLAQQVPLWLMDEPTEHLDPGHIWDTLPSLIRDHTSTGGSVVLVAHDPDWAAQIADQVVVLDADQWSWVSAGEGLTEQTLSQLYGHGFKQKDGRWWAV